MGRRICTQYKTFEFVSNGIVNDELNGETTVITRETFIYVPEYVDYTGERTRLLDNLIHIYELDAEKVTVFEGPCYTVTAHVHDEDLVPQIRVYGEVSKIELVPEYTIEFTKTREVTKYNALADATLMGEKEVYVVNYTKTTKDPVEPTPVDPVTPVNPKTGDSVDVYMGILAVSLLSLGTTVYRKKHN